MCTVRSTELAARARTALAVTALQQLTPPRALPLESSRQSAAANPGTGMKGASPAPPRRVSTCSALPGRVRRLARRAIAGALWVLVAAAACLVYELFSAPCGAQRAAHAIATVWREERASVLMPLHIHEDSPRTSATELGVGGVATAAATTAWEESCAWLPFRNWGPARDRPVP